MTSKNFNIKQTVHKNIEQKQFPSFSNHRSLVGWCSMNYPKVLVNPIYLQKQKLQPQQKYELETLFQMKNPIDRTKNQFIKPFSSFTPENINRDSPEKEDDRNDQNTYKGNYNSSSFTLCTTKHQIKSQIFQENNKKSQQYSSVLPLRNILGPNRDGKYDRKIRQIGEVYYNPPNEGQQMRHLKKLPNTIIDEQNLLEIMDQKLQYLDLSYKKNISNELINKIGYLAPNIKSLNLSSVPITNLVIIELGKSCHHLQKIDISLCKELDEDSIIHFLKDSQKLKSFSANHLQDAITDATLEVLGQNQNLQILNINFCNQVTATGLEFLTNNQFLELGLSGLPHIKAEILGRIFLKSANKLKNINLAFNNTKEINGALMQKLGMCTKLENIVLTGCETLSDDGINSLIYGQKGKSKQPEGFADLKILKVGGITNVSDQLFQIVKRCPTLQFLQANNLQRLSDHFLEQIKNHPTLKTLLINFTPNITDEKIKDVKELNKTLNIVRNIVKMTDPADDGLRMPIPLANLKMKKKKKDGKKK